MEHVVAEVTAELVRNGLLGSMLVLLAFVVVLLVRHILGLYAEIGALNDKLLKVSDKSNAALNNTSGVIAALTVSLENERKFSAERFEAIKAITGQCGAMASILAENRSALGTVLADVAVTPAPGALPLRADQLELVAYRRTVGGRGANAKTPADSTEPAAVPLQRAPQRGDSLHLTLGVNPPDAPGTYAYKLVLRTAGTGGFGDAPWVTQYSSDNPTPAHDAGKTLNLATFVRDLRAAASSVAQPRVAVWYLTVRKL